MKVEKDYMYHSYKIQYVVGKEMIVSYLDFSCSVKEYNDWLERHKIYIREMAISIITS